MYFRGNISPTVISRRNTLIMLELLDEEAGIAEAAVVGDFRNGQVGSGERVAGAFDAEIVEVVDGGTVYDRLKISAEILGGHARQTGEFL